MPITLQRSIYALALSRIDEIHPDMVDAPMGLDVQPVLSGVLAGGVFSRIALIVSLDEYAHLIPRKFYTVYRFPRKPGGAEDSRHIKARIGFKDDVQAVGVTVVTCKKLLPGHESVAAQSHALLARLQEQHM